MRSSPGAEKGTKANEAVWHAYGGASAGSTRDNTKPTHKAALRSSRLSSGRAADNAYRTKTLEQLRELSADMTGDLKKLRGSLRKCEEGVGEAERSKQAKHAELQLECAGSALDWIVKKAESDFPNKFDAAIEKAREEMQAAQQRVQDTESKLLQVRDALATSRSTARQDETTIFIHFIPPPLRAQGKAHLPWIVHVCDGSGCYEARHVSIASISGFETYEGPPPEQLEGRACRCQIANHHLRGFGRVRWDGEDAIVESAAIPTMTAADAKPQAMVNGHAYKEQAARQGLLLAEARDEIKRLRIVREQAAKQQHKEVSDLRDAFSSRLATMQQAYKELSSAHEALKAQHEQAMVEWKRRLSGDGSEATVT